jgi:hypothetical protein
MRHILALAAILAVGGPVYGQQDQPQEQPRPMPIPTNPGPIAGGPLPSPNPRDSYAAPLPNWPSPQRYASRVTISGLVPAVRPCAIFTIDGKRYRYFEGGVPLGTAAKKTYSLAELNKITGKGGIWRILAANFTEQDLNAARYSCMAVDTPQAH